MKRERHPGRAAHDPRFPRLYAAASLKHTGGQQGGGIGREFSAALCRGLIEARSPIGAAVARLLRFPRLYAAASLKRTGVTAQQGDKPWFSAALCRGLIEAIRGSTTTTLASLFSAALCRGLIEARSAACSARPARRGFPRLYAAASLKPVDVLYSARNAWTFSAALCRGLIEANIEPMSA